MVHYQLLCGGSDSKGVCVCVCVCECVSVSVSVSVCVRQEGNDCNDSLSSFWKADFEVAFITDRSKTRN